MVKTDNISLSGFGDWLSNAWDNVSGWITDAANWVGDTFFGGSHEVNQTNQSIANQNIAFQQQENEIIRQREDTAYQRAAADLQAAGLSKTLAAGHPASASATTAPSNTFQMQRNLAGQNALKSMTDFYFNKRADQRAADLNDAQIANLDAKTRSEEISNKYKEDVYKADILLKTVQSEQSKSYIELLGVQKQAQEIQNRIASIEESYKVDDLVSIINSRIADSVYKLAEADYTEMSMKKLSVDISKEILDMDRLKVLTAKDAKELEIFVQDLAYKKLQETSLKHDINYAQKYGLPVGQLLNGQAGSWTNAARSWLKQMQNGSFTFSPEGVMSNPDGTGYVIDPISGLVDYY